MSFRSALPDVDPRRPGRSSLLERSFIAATDAFVFGRTRCKTPLQIGVQKGRTADPIGEHLGILLLASEIQIVRDSLLHGRHRSVEQQYAIDLAATNHVSIRL